MTLKNILLCFYYRKSVLRRFPHAFITPVLTGNWGLRMGKMIFIGKSAVDVWKFAYDELNLLEKGRHVEKINLSTDNSRSAAEEKTRTAEEEQLARRHEALKAAKEFLRLRS